MKVYQDNTTQALFEEFDEAPARALRLGYPSGRVHEVPLNASPDLFDVLADVEGVDVRTDPRFQQVRHTVVMGGAGDSGAYKDDLVRALGEAGISNVRGSPKISMGGSLPGGFLVDAALSVARNNNDISPRFIDNPGLRPPSDLAPGEQYNLVGYSYGAAMVAQQALTEARRGRTVDNLVLIGAPINQDLVDQLDKEPNIRNVQYINLDDQGDPIHPGMTDAEIYQSTPQLVLQMLQEAGHFYYSGDNAEGNRRRRELAEELYRRGLR